LVGSQWGDDEADVDFVTDTVFPAIGVTFGPGSFAANGIQNAIAYQLRAFNGRPNGRFDCG
jgi:hypothetical protein